jgi:hypothetical protein
VDPKVLAAADLGEAEVQEILGHRGLVKTRASMEFLVLWFDGEQTWESWGMKLEHVDVYIFFLPHGGTQHAADQEVVSFSGLSSLTGEVLWSGRLSSYGSGVEGSRGSGRRVIDQTSSLIEEVCMVCAKFSI